MREDMDKVIVERPRVYGDGGKSVPLKGTKKRLQKQFKSEDCEGVPSWESNAPHRMYGYDCKQFSERLGPLRKFLRSCVGRLWNDVHSEICANLRPDSVVQSHVRDHVDLEVEKFVTEFINGVPYDNKGMPVHERFYVHPETGILCENTERSRRGRYRERPKKYVPGADANHQYHCVKGVWYEVELASFPTELKDNYGWVRDTVYDVLLCNKKGFLFGGSTRSDCRNQYGREVYATKKRQLNSREIKKLHLWETPQGITARSEMAEQEILEKKKRSA